jgi:dTDP-4-amino-4,6-dideoxygalactose transaminase
MILMNDFKSEPPKLRKDILDAIARVIDSGWYVLGKSVEEFEQKWAEICKVRYCVGVGNGMDAIELALRAIGIKAGDEVITTPMTAFATVLSIIRAGATPVLADINPNTALLSHESTRRCINKKTKAIVLVHLYGQVRDMDIWRDLCAEQNLALIEDCAQAHLASWGGISAGAHGIAGAFSFYPTKNLGALGDAGALITSNKQISDRVKSLRNYGQTNRYEHPLAGMNSRLDEIQAVILTERLRWLSSFTNRRREIAAEYENRIVNPKITLLTPPQEESAHARHLFCVVSDERDELQSFLSKRNIQTLIHYPIPIHQQESCRNIQRSPDGLNHSETHARSCISIPCHPQLSTKDVDHIINSINEW